MDSEHVATYNTGSIERLRLYLAACRLCKTKCIPLSSPVRQEAGRLVETKETLEDSTPQTTSQPELDALEVRQQLSRLLVHPLFANSRRYPTLLTYIVEQTLAGKTSELKERSIAIEVFGRPTDYDSSSDPVVRITAGEVRKRLTQYYFDPAHSGELQIELPLGTYVPLFHAPAEEEEPEELEADELTAYQTETPLWRRWQLWLGALVLTLTACLGGVGLGYLAHIYSVKHRPPSLMDRFWAPVTTARGIVTYCLGDPSKTVNLSGNADEASLPESDDPTLYFRLHYAGHLALADVVTLTRTAAELERLHKEFRVQPASETTFAQMREGPSVLIGAFDNVWTLRITEKLRYGFESRGGDAVLVDRKAPQQTNWASRWDVPYRKLSRDYAIVARIHDNLTGQPVVIAAGISEEGTEAAGEMLYNPEFMAQLLFHAPSDWEKKNMEAVIETQVIGGNPGPPRVIAIEYW